VDGVCSEASEGNYPALPWRAAETNEKLKAKIVVEEASGNGRSVVHLYCCFPTERVKFHTASTTLKLSSRLLNE